LKQQQRSATSVAHPLTALPSHTAEQAFEQPLAPRDLPKFGLCNLNQLKTLNVSQYTRAGYRLRELRAYESPRSGCIEVVSQTLESPSTLQRVVVKSADSLSLRVSSGTITASSVLAALLRLPTFTPSHTQTRPKPT